MAKTAAFATMMSALCLVFLLFAPPAAAQDEASDSATPMTNGTDELATLRQELLSPVVAVRVRAIMTLSERGDQGAVNQLVAILRHDPSPEVRGWALRGLSLLDPTGSEAVIRETQREDPDPRVRELAGQLLVRSPATGGGDEGLPVETGERPLLDPNVLSPNQVDASEMAERRRLATRARRLARIGLSFFGVGAAIGAMSPALIDVDVDATISLAAIGSAFWLADTPFMLLADSYSRRAEGQQRRSGLNTTAWVFYATAILLTSLHIVTGFYATNEGPFIAMSVINGLFSTTARVMTIVLGGGANARARRVLHELDALGY